MYHDRLITCSECDGSFLFSAGEQEFHASRGLADPKRCPACRRARQERELHDVVCEGCGAVARVPFKPRGDRPVFCADCYRERVPRRRR